MEISMNKNLYSDSNLPDYGSLLEKRDATGSPISIYQRYCELPEIEIKILDHGKPYYTAEDLKPKTTGAAGIDLKCCQPWRDAFTGKCKLNIATGISIYIKNANYVGLVFMRSSTPVEIINAVAVVDSDYQGEITLKCNPGKRDPELGDRIAQLLFVPITHPTLKIVEEFSEKTDRSTNGFGHTGR